MPKVECSLCGELLDVPEGQENSSLSEHRTRVHGRSADSIPDGTADPIGGVPLLSEIPAPPPVTGASDSPAEDDVFISATLAWIVAFSGLAIWAFVGAPPHEVAMMVFFSAIVAVVPALVLWPPITWLLRRALARWPGAKDPIARGSVVLLGSIVLGVVVWGFIASGSGSDPAPPPSPDPPTLADECNWDDLDGWERSNYRSEAEYLRICRQVMEDVEDGDFVDGLSGG